MSKMDDGGQAVVEGDYIVVRVWVDALQDILDGSSEFFGISDRYRVTDKTVFAQEICRAMNREDERGETPFHKMFDAAMEHAIDQGCEGIESRSSGGASDAE